MDHSSTMIDVDLQNFARQLAFWADQVIENGRTPFRRVELFPTIHTASGDVRPPLVFWINRQSLMAGGVLLLPQKSVDEQLKLGTELASALGLSHFVTWSSKDICFWNCLDTTPTCSQQIPVHTTDDPESFRAPLLEIMDALKLLSVTGLVPAEKLSASYLVNLFSQTLDAARPSLIDLHQQHHRQQKVEDDTVETRADQRNRLTLLRLLALSRHNKLTGDFTSETLEQGMIDQLMSLPKHLAAALELSPAEKVLPLPGRSAVCFHHLLLRLEQIDWRTPTRRADEALRQLLRSDLDLELTSPEVPRLQIDWPRPQSDGTLLNELSISQKVLAETALLRELDGHPPAQQHNTHIVNCTELPETPQIIQARFTNQTLCQRDELRRYTALLRTSWPTRRFQFAANIPLWVVEAIHLLGLTPQGATLQLDIPADWLCTEHGLQLWELLHSGFQLEKIAAGEQSNTTLSLTREKSGPDTTCVMHPDGQRWIDWNEVVPHRAQLAFALTAPADLYSFVKRHDFQPCSSTKGGEDEDAALERYAMSTIGQALWTLIQHAPLPADPKQLRVSGSEHGWLVPPDDILRQIAWNTTEETNRGVSSEVDTLLTSLFADSLPALPIVGKSGEDTPSPQKRTKRSTRDDVFHHLLSIGVPTFPDQYLYQIDRPQTITYRFSPPLTVISEFLGEVELRDADGGKITTTHQVTAEALKLCAEQEKTDVDLPVDPLQIEEILTRYRIDLRNLRRELSIKSLSCTDGPQAAARLQRSIWKDLTLPPWSWLDE